MSHVDEAVLDLTVAQASLLVDILGVAPPPGLVDPDDEPVTDRDHAAVAPGLIERRILDGEGTVAAPVADMLTVVGSPHLVARAVHEVGGVAEIRSFAVRPEMAVEQRSLGSGMVRFTPFNPVELVERIMTYVAPGHEVDVGDEAAEGISLSFECPGQIIDQLFTGDGSDEPPSTAGRVAMLTAIGVDANVARDFAEAVEAVQSTSSVTVLHRPVEQEIIGVDLTWMDAGSHGLWLTEPADDGTNQRVIERLTAADLAAELIRFLPFG